MKKKFTEDDELKEEILSQLKNINKTYGKPYCPCVNPEAYNADIICPCKEFRENIPVGEECHCGLWVKVEE
ncbi:MAG: ferredoxin-thioredoxin reductase catalytic domain-containing protein [Bacilli bacterium]